MRIGMKKLRQESRRKELRQERQLQRQQWLVCRRDLETRWFPEHQVRLAALSKQQTLNQSFIACPNRAHAHKRTHRQVTKRQTISRHFGVDLYCGTKRKTKSKEEKKNTDRGFHCLSMRRTLSERVYPDMAAVSVCVCVFVRVHEFVSLCTCKWPMLCFFNELSLHTWLIG